jgi:proteasome lid subunit RPN8/RPN11
VSNTAPLFVTAAAMQHAIRMCRIQLPSETCGFIVAEKDDVSLGSRMVWMSNVADNPIKEYAMGEEDVRKAYAEFDALGEEPVAAFHSHPTSEPILSLKDLERAVDPSLAYLVFSFMNPVRPVARAYRVEQFIGNPVATQVEIQVQRSASDSRSGLPLGPWALMAGNHVRISYRRTGKSALSTCVATVIGCDGTVVQLNPVHKTSAQQIPLERISAIHVLKEGKPGVAARKQLRGFAGEARALLAGNDVGPLPSLLAALHLAFPPGITITMDVQR